MQNEYDGQNLFQILSNQMDRRRHRTFDVGSSIIIFALHFYRQVQRYGARSDSLAFTVIMIVIFRAILSFVSIMAVIITAY